LTAARTGAVIGANWKEIDINAKLWTLPLLMSRRGHRVPLSDGAMAILKKMAAIRQGDFIFPGNKTDQPPSAARLRALLKRMGRENISVAGFRHTFWKWAATTSFPEPVITNALGHVSRDFGLAFERGDLPAHRRALMEAWAKFCDSTATAA
jgi:integrase